MGYIDWYLHKQRLDSIRGRNNIVVSRILGGSTGSPLRVSRCSCVSIKGFPRPTIYMLLVSNGLLTRVRNSNRTKLVLRTALFAYLAMVFCPIQYWAPAEDVDNTWFFALNYAAAHHLVMGRDIAWTSGPLAYLAAPMDIGNNLVQGLVFQAALWTLLLAVLWDLFSRGSFSLKNLAFFSVFLGLSGPLYHEQPNPLGAGDLLLVGALILLVHFRLRGGISRYITALVMLGLVPLIKFVGVMMVAGAVAGLIVGRIAHDRSRAWREIVLAAVVPAFVWGAGCWLAAGSLHAFAAYLRSSLELSSGYTLAMATWGHPVELLAGFEALVLLAIALALLAACDRQTAVFFGLLFAAPVFVSIKHAFVRQDSHIIYIFGFVAVATGLVALATVLEGQRATVTLTVVMLLLATLCQDNIGAKGLRTAIPAVTGIKVPSLIWRALRLGHLRQMLNAESQQNFPVDLRVEPEIKAIVQHEPVASLSLWYSNALMDDLNLVLYPVIQRYSAYTPYLDELNADWVRNKGPRFLIFDGKSIDGRHPWTETPAMWVEVYRWYDTRLLGAHNLLLERRSTPRFMRFEPVASSRLRFGAELQMPVSQPVFWSMKCSLSTTGKLRQLLFRVLEVTMTVDKKDGRSDVFRVPLAVVGSPSPGNYLPSNLSEFASVFGDDKSHNFAVERLSFGGPGSFAYVPDCGVEFLRPVR